MKDPEVVIIIELDADGLAPFLNAARQFSPSLDQSVSRFLRFSA
jgi:hypothetical protein